MVEIFDAAQNECTLTTSKLQQIVVKSNIKYNWHLTKKENTKKGMFQSTVLGIMVS